MKIRRPDQRNVCWKRKLRQLLCSELFYGIFRNAFNRVNLKRTELSCRRTPDRRTVWFYCCNLCCCRCVYALIFDQILKRRLASKPQRRTNNMTWTIKHHCCRDLLLHHRILFFIATGMKALKTIPVPKGTTALFWFILAFTFIRGTLSSKMDHKDCSVVFLAVLTAFKRA